MSDHIFLNETPKDYSEEVQAIAVARLPVIVSKEVLRLSTGGTALGLVDDAAEIVRKAAEQHTA